MKFLFQTYFFFNTVTHILSSLRTTSQVNLATKALFMFAIFLMPNPPSNLGLQMES